ncbi:MAG: NAD(P)-dependent oxidoreductase [Nitrospinota bacterium]|nr:NAD(P)-dependent oxidoreductase [Nitrospinota bacterium]
MKRVLVTGGSGFVGRHVLPLLVDKGYEVHATAFDDSHIPLRGVDWHPVDLLNNEKTEQLLSNIKPSHLLHLAWYVEQGKYWTSLENFKWVEASLALTRIFADKGGKRAVFAGTCAEYDWSFKLLSENTTPCVSNTPYSACKNALYSLLASFSGASDISYAWGRLFFLFGPHEHPARLVSSLVRSLLRDQEFECSEGRQVRDFLYIEDAARAFVSLLESPATGAVNIGSGQGISVRNMIKTISKQIGKDHLIQFGARPTNDNEPAEFIADINRLKNEVGWQPKYNLDQSLDLTIQWWKAALERESI